MWVKPINGGLAKHHADSDLIAALQNLKARETSGEKTALLLPVEGSECLLVSHLWLKDMMVRLLTCICRMLSMLKESLR